MYYFYLLIAWYSRKYSTFEWKIFEIIEISQNALFDRADDWFSVVIWASSCRIQSYSISNLWIQPHWAAENPLSVSRSSLKTLKSSKSDIATWSFSEASSNDRVQILMDIASYVYRTRWKSLIFRQFSRNPSRSISWKYVAFSPCEIESWSFWEASRDIQHAIFWD